MPALDLTKPVRCCRPSMSDECESVMRFAEGPWAEQIRGKFAEKQIGLTTEKTTLGNDFMVCN